ncbi:mgtA regulatory leader peptide MgtL [Trabulsiella guamensis]|uniref:mgtA regulatory leader peptide MgtL n=1 Tax=Trabulsiella guamensis TaxID=158852 RepID=UPI003CCC2D6C
MGKIWLMPGLVARSYDNAIIAQASSFIWLTCAVSLLSLTGGCMDPDPTPHHRWGYFSLR